MKQNYNTKQKKSVLSCLEAGKDKSMTVDGVCAALALRKETASRSTVYRRLEELCNEGKVSRFAPEHGKSVTYRYIGNDCGEENHFHLICTACGGVLHTHCDELASLFIHMAEEHGFKIDEKKTVLYGICEKCKKASENKPV